MDSQIFHATLQQQAAYGVGHATDPDLQAGTILDFSRNEPSYSAVGLAGLRIGQFRTRLMIPLNDEINFFHMCAVVSTEDVRYFTIDFDDDQLCAFDDGPLPDIGW